jgi:Ion transport protein
MTTVIASSRQHGNAYDLFILVLTVVSLMVMVLLWLPFSPETMKLLRVYDNVICVVFLFDFALSLLWAPSKRGYFVGERGWLDLLGSLPSVGAAKAIGFLRLARLSRVATPAPTIALASWHLRPREPHASCRSEAEHPECEDDYRSEHHREDVELHLLEDEHVHPIQVGDHGDRQRDRTQQGNP